ncbi:ABC transporter permease [Williamsia phyllosphaerae]|uniref:ABC transporter permease n=1 Tax=Williamsia phyllosphaerae TaxID=885042 RepID=A0ABQ1U928_9NOCA|nr:ABC transporter permease [Williamsia phyllosphaerae]GGF13504.1 hypothetical protein GCM10007298_06810 [Williamsia phyllosphaerae]
MTRAVVNEFAKMRRLRVVPLVLAMVVGVVGLSCVELTAPDFVDSLDDPDGDSWTRLLVGMATAVPLVSPILLAALASRQVDIEHQGNGWLLSHAAGLAQGRLMRAKFAAVGLILIAATVICSSSVIALGAVIGIASPPPLGRWAVYTASVTVVGLVVLAFHICLAARIENQLVGMGIGVVGVFLAASSSGLPTWSSHLTPWGYYSLAAPADYVDGALVTVHPAHLSLLALAVVGVAAFCFVTSAARSEV